MLSVLEIGLNVCQCYQLFATILVLKVISFYPSNPWQKRLIKSLEEEVNSAVPYTGHPTSVDIKHLCIHKNHWSCNFLSPYYREMGTTGEDEALRIWWGGWKGICMWNKNSFHHPKKVLVLVCFQADNLSGVWESNSRTCFIVDIVDISDKKKARNHGKFLLY